MKVWKSYHFRNIGEYWNYSTRKYTHTHTHIWGKRKLVNVFRSLKYHHMSEETDWVCNVLEGEFSPRWKVVKI